MALLSIFCFSARAGIDEFAPARDLEPVVDMIYDVDLASAAAAADGLSARYPTDPAGPFYRALVTYQRFILEPARSTTTLSILETQVARTKDKALKIAPSDPARSFYFLGAAEGFHARALVAQGRLVRAISEGTRGIKHLRKGIELDPGLEDAYLGVGMYHYFRTRVPGFAKPFAFLFFGESGNREQGLSELRRAAEKGQLAKTEALSILASIYCSEEERLWVQSAEIYDKLVASYPRNPFYRLRAAYTQERMGQWDKAAAYADPDGEWLAGLEPAAREDVRALALYRAAEAWLLGGHPEKVETALDRIESRRVPEPLVDWVLLRRANVYDWQGNKLAADRLYGAVKDPEAARAAKQYLRLRYPNTPNFFKPLTGLEYPY